MRTKTEESRSLQCRDLLCHFFLCTKWSYFYSSLLANFLVWAVEENCAAVRKQKHL